MKKKILAIDLSIDEVKTLELEISNSQVKVKKWAAAAYSGEDTLLSLHEMLIVKIQRNRMSAREAVVAVSGDEVVYKIIHLPEMPKEEVRSAIAYKLVNAIPFPADEAIFDYYRIEQQGTESGQKYFVAIAPRKIIYKAIEETKKAGLRIREIIPSSCALAASFCASCRDNASLVYIGKKSSIIVLIKNGQVVFAREAKVGGDTITQSMVGVVYSESGKVELDYDKAEEIKDEFGIPLDKREYENSAHLPAEEILAMMRPALEKIGAEILRTIEYYRQDINDQTEFNKSIYITGGASKTKHIAEYFKNEMDISIEEFPFEEDVFGEKFVSVAPFFSLALGCAIKRSDMLSFLPEDYKHPAKTFINKTVTMPTITAAYLFLLFAAYMTVYLNSYLLQRQFNDYQNKLKAAGAASGIPLLAGGISESEFNKPGQKDVFAKILNDLELKTPASIYFSNIRYDNPAKQLTIKGMLIKKTGENKLSQFISGIGESRYIKSVDLSNLRESTNTDKRGAFDFEIKAVVSDAGY